MSSTLDFDLDTLTDRSYITEVTLGLLQDVGLDVNFDSKYVTTIGSQNSFSIIFATYFPLKGSALTSKIINGTITVNDTFSGDTLGTTTTDETGSYALTYSSGSPYVIITCEGGNSANSEFLGRLSGIKLRAVSYTHLTLPTSDLV